MSDPTRTATAVTLLAGDEIARRMVLAWPLVGRELRDRALLVAWSKAAAVPLSELMRRADALRRHGLCRDDGIVDPEALRVVQHVAAQALRAQGARR